MEFAEFPKIPRYSRDVVVTEKIDGTNGCIKIVESLHGLEEADPLRTAVVEYRGGVFNIYAGSRTRWITPKDDNFGFALWVREYADQLVALGVGTHFGEWWGQGIQRNYGLTGKRFSLFNTSRWNDETKPACCHVVPILAQSKCLYHAIQYGLAMLVAGSVAAPGFMKPEGVIAYHVAGKLYFKKTIEKDDEWKGKRP